MIKNLATTLIVTSLCLSPAIAFAQAGGAPPPPPGPQPGMMAPHRPDAARMRQMGEQFERIHRAEREKILAALTPAHRALLASLVGQLAISAHPDYKAATGRLDAALNPGEKAAILAANTAAMTQMRTLFAQQRAQWQQSHASQGQPSQGQSSQHAMRPGREHHRTPTAGAIAMMVAAGRGGPPMMFHHRGGPKHGSHPAPAAS